MRCALLLVLAALCGFLSGPLPRGWSDDDVPMPPPKVEPRANLKPSELLAILNETIDRDEIAEPMEFGKAIERINAILSRRGKSLPVRINMDAFKEELAEAPDLHSIQVTCLEQPARPTVRQLLHFYMAQFPERSASFVVGPGFVEITTKDRAMPFIRLSTPVTLQVRSRPLFLVLDDLFEQTGVSIVVDSRFAQRTRMPVSAMFADPVSLRDALYLLLNMTDLHMVTVGNSVYVTSPQNAYRVYWERMTKSYLMLDPFAPEI